MFKNEEARIGYYRLKKDYEAFEQAVSGRSDEVSRLLEKTFDRFTEECWDEIAWLFEEGWFDLVIEEYENTKNAGSIEGLFEVVANHDKEK